ncbi:MAG: glycosyl hydrolase family 8 [Candidatus Binatia bacterium]
MTGKGMWRAAVLALVLAAPASAQNHPFGSHPVAYAAGAITPSHVSQAGLDQAVRDFYDLWKVRYLAPACGVGRYVVLSKTQAGNLTVSEAHGYGMLLAVLMAGHDPDARAIFDGMVTYFRDHPSVFTPGLMAWYQKKSCASAEGGDSASDGDLDIAYALLLADKQWGSCGAIDYLAEAQSVLAAIRSAEVDPSGRYVLLGDWATPGDPTYHASTRTSDFMPGHLRAFAAATGDSDWTDVLDHTYQVVDSIQTTYSPSTGLLPDFVVNPLGSAAPAAAEFLEGPNDGDYDYNACRDPWRIGTDFVIAGEARAKTAVQRMTTFFRADTGNDPGDIQSGYQLDGSLSPGADYRSMAFVAPLGVGAMADAANQAWLNAIWDLVVATSVDDEAYFENTLKLLSMVVMSGNWWTPAAVAGGCVPQGTPMCSDGGYLGNAQIKLTGLLSGPAAQALQIKGSVFFPAGIPVAAPYSGGAQILVEDVGSGNSAVFELSRFTNAVPPAAAGNCSGDDGWDVRPTTTTYRNRSGLLDPPTCTPGSARGLDQLRLKARSTNQIDFLVKTKRSTIATPVGPLRATLVLGHTQAASDTGQCAIGTALPCTANSSGSSRKCR